MKKHLLYTIVALVSISMLLIALRIYVTDNDSKPPITRAQTIPAGSYFAHVRKLSAGSKTACLQGDPNLDAQLSADEALPYSQSFNGIINSVIIDMPAGFTDVNLHTFAADRANGSIIFSDENQRSTVKDLRAFNFVVTRPDDTASWQLQSFVACNE